MFECGNGKGSSDAIREKRKTLKADGMVNLAQIKADGMVNLAQTKADGMVNLAQIY